MLMAEQPAFRLNDSCIISLYRTLTPIMTMSHNSFPPRRNSVGVRVGSITVGGGAPIVVQSMTNTDTEDEVATTAQVEQLARAGSELVRITVNTTEAAKAVPAIR